MNPSAPTNPSLLSSLSRAPSRTAAVYQQVLLSLSSDFEPRLSQQTLSLSFHCRFLVGFGDFSYVLCNFGSLPILGFRDISYVLCDFGSLPSLPTL
ncbi:hypothetical protein I3842_15G109600 [Carya illinoinensis]|nr:hypothetical protein I3842_15G109600 [Carya illinoinensis]